jgi:sulfatase maturation enzyme AslB (radical SAM superfamily)
MSLSAELAADRDPAADRRREFKRLVREVNVEISDFCNRICPYCPYELKKRGDSRNIDLELVERLFADLAKVDFAGLVHLNLYNEPLHDFPFFLEVNRLRRKYLPNSQTLVNSNGDYINAKIMQEIIDNEIDSICVTIHYKKSWDVTAQSALVDRFIAKTGLPLTPKVCDDHIIAESTFGRTRVMVRALDFALHGNDRGASLYHGVLKTTRTRPCDVPEWQINVNSVGDVYPCCNIYPRVHKNGEYRVGSLREASIFDVYFSPEYQNFLAKAKAINAHAADIPAVCRTCTEPR